METLSLKEKERVEEMRDAFSSYGQESFGMPLNDYTFLRYLRARNFDKSKAVIMLQNTIKWRESFGLQYLQTDWMEKMRLENKTGKLYVRGADKAGHPILYMRPKFENTRDQDGNLKHLVFNLEKAIACSNGYHGGVEKIVLLVDFLGVKNGPPLSTATATLSILQNHYPERLFRAYVLNPHWAFKVFYTLVTPFIDPVTKSKIVLLDGDISKVGSTLTEEYGFDPTVLETSFGGLDARPFDSSQYLKAEFTEEPLNPYSDDAPKFKGKPMGSSNSNGTTYSDA